MPYTSSRRVVGASAGVSRDSGPGTRSAIAMAISSADLFKYFPANFYDSYIMALPYSFKCAIVVLAVTWLCVGRFPSAYSGATPLSPFVFTAAH
jgi:hypothetical protein